ncbi:hypothetical protein SNEBB_004068 [Seison nebaliae]|nr:hypothetical protein SNEBB_004068 [Seison nebaliae]
MTTLDDKLLGEKQHNYCSSSSGSDDENDSNDEDNQHPSQTNEETRESCVIRSNGKATQNTGPKGVIHDWKQYRLESEQQENLQQQRTVKLAYNSTVQSNPLTDDNTMEAINDEQFLESYRKKRIDEIQAKQEKLLKDSNRLFGKVIEMNRENFVEMIDVEGDNDTLILVLIYSLNEKSSRNAKSSFSTFSKYHKTIKCCQIETHMAELSINFSMKACPSILCYQRKDLVHSFINLADILPKDFDAIDLEQFLYEQSIIDSKLCELSDDDDDEEVDDVDE